MVGFVGSAIVAIGFTLAAALPNYFTYAQWARLPDEGRAAYIAGTFDALVNQYDDDAGRAVARHYSDCVARAQLSSAQMGDKLKTYVAARPELAAGTVQAALLKYLGDLCGAQPPR